MWLFFEKSVDNARCIVRNKHNKECGKVLSLKNASTSTLLKHLKFCHKELCGKIWENWQLGCRILLEVERLRGALLRANPTGAGWINANDGHFVSRCDSKSRSISVSFSYQSHLLPVPDQDPEPDRSPDSDGDTDTDIYNFVCKNLQVSVDFPKIFDKILTPAILRCTRTRTRRFLYPYPDPYPDILYPYPIVPGLRSVPGRSLIHTSVCRARQKYEWALSVKAHSAQACVCDAVDWNRNSIDVALLLTLRWATEIQVLHHSPHCRTREDPTCTFISATLTTFLHKTTLFK